MNKYSKRALKTTATVGMSLAMVLSGVASPLTNVKAAAAVPATCPVGSNGVEEFFKNGISIENFKLANSETEIDATKMKLNGTDAGTTTNLNLFIALSGAGATTIALEDIYSYVIKTITDCQSGITRDNAILLRDTISAYMEMFTTGTLGTPLVATDLQLAKSAEPASGTTITIDGVNAHTIDMAKGGDLKAIFDKLAVTNASGTVTNGVYTPTATGLAVATNLTAAKKDLKALNSFEGKYIDNLTEEEKGAFYIVKDTLESNISAVDTSTYDSELADFVLSFDLILQNDIKGVNTTVADTVRGATKSITLVTGWTVGTAVNTSSSSSIKARISKIKNHENYTRFSDESSVIAILDAYESMLDAITSTADAFKGDEFKTYTSTKVGDDDRIIKNYVFSTIDTAATTNAAKASVLAKNIDSAEFAVLKDVKENVIDLLYTMETKLVGNYYADKSDYVSTATAAQKSKFTANFPSYLTTLVDNEKGLFGYDVVANRMVAVATAITAATTDIEKLTTTNIKNSDKAKLVAAEDAVYEILNGKYKYNVTDKEAKAIRAAEKKIENLREAFEKLGTTEVAGWYDMGNGNWGYNNEDGTPAAYKWVASGSNWYFVRDGKMARNTWLAANSTDWYYLGSDGKMATSVTVDGCWINSLGIYKK